MVPQQQRRRRRRVVLPRTSERRVVVARGAGGFGFTIAGQRPCVVSAVAAGGPAERAGLRAGDALLAVDGASVARAPHASVARLVAAAPGAIALSVAPRESPPTDTEDTEPDERCRTRRRHPPPRRRPQMLHHPGCHAAPSSSGVNEILQNLSRAQLTPNHAARLECRAVVGYLGTIETPQAAATAAPGNVRTAVRKLRQERRPAAPVLLSVLPNALLLRRHTGQILAQYKRDRIIYAGCGSDADRRYFGLVTSAESSEAEASHSCHVFAVDPRMADHSAHIARAREFQIACTIDPVAERCLEFPPSAEYVVGVIRGMYSLPPDDCISPTLAQISRLAVKGDSPAMGNFARNRPAFRAPRDRRPCREDIRIDGQDFVSNSPQPSNHSEMTTTSSNSDSGIGFHNDCRNIADRILVVDFVGQQPPPNRFRKEMPRRPVGMVGCNIDDGSFLSNTTPVVDGFAGQGRPLNLDDVILNANDLQPVRHVSPRKDDDNYNYNNIYSNVPSTSSFNGVYDQVYTENEGSHYEMLPQLDLEADSVAENFNSVEMYEERSRQDCNSNESVENVTVISGGTSKASMDSVSVYSTRSHEDTRPSRRRHMQASLDDMLVLARRDQVPSQGKDEGTFVHPASVKCKVRKSMKPLNLLSKTKNILTGRDRERNKEERRRAISASAGDVCEGEAGGRAEPLPAAASEPDLRDAQNEQDSPFRRWTTGGSAASSYRHNEPRTKFSKQMSEGPSTSKQAGGPWRGGRVARWSLGLEHLLADNYGVAAFARFLQEEYAEENIRFWYKCELFANAPDLNTRARIASQIWHQFLDDEADYPVNVDAAARNATILGLCQTPLPADLFRSAQNQIFSLLKFDSYPRFLRSAIHAECARADLRGEEPPYGPYVLPDDDNIPDNAPSSSATPSTSKLKKSVSNASERRRSGGSSLLPWKLRTASRDRASTPSACAAPPPAEPQTTVTDVVKQAQPGQGQSSLCRVVLPDGATSVVELDEGVTVRRVVDRLLQRRNICCNNYDVMLRIDGNEVDTQAASTVLGGREAVVERRCVVRIEVAGRCVAVRCRAARRLRHVLRPVVARYAPGRAAQRAVLRDGAVVHPDTSMQELDGARLQIVELNECGEYLRADARQRDNDADSLSDLALSVQDPRDDDQSTTGSLIRCRTDRVPPTTAPGAAGPNTSGANCSSGSGLPGSSGAGMPGIGGSTGGRVRAALRPGPPLHHHPPDFLDNLRETQRQRLQSKNEASPAPRTPPPLPPKPSQRSAPTVV